ncbi:ABC transporter permease [Nocardioides bruguierae]|uniref:ABC transporter permease n=1 Tax=Nocardioides bruguierae TaxID=2945102 RepID=UPI0020221F09|nr:ABC transporter permease [Nocardioides bruguierae]MCL8024739.1 ABC transporter permease [Nocardioides bruguierae]
MTALPAPAATAVPAPAPTGRVAPLSPTLLRLELLRLLRDPVTWIFSVGLPGFLYVMLGTSTEYADVSAGHGNLAMFVMIAMAAYGAVTATVGVGGRAALERTQGWGRQLGLTPLADLTWVGTKAATGVVLASLPALLVYGLGLALGAEGTVGAWLGSLAVVLVGASLFSLLGLAIGLGFGTDQAVAATGGVVVVLGFLGNVFYPLSGVLLDIARFSPMYGYVGLARYPLTDGWTSMGAGPAFHDSLGLLIANVSVWTVLFGLVALLLVRRARSRQ